MLQRAWPRFFFDDKWRWLWQLLLYIPIVGVGVAVIVGPCFWLVQRTGWLPSPLGTGTGWPAIGALILVRYVLLFAAVLFSTHLAQRWLRNESLGDLGLRFQPGWWRDLLLGCGLGLLLMVIAIGLSWRMGWYQILGFAWESQPLSEWLAAGVRSMFPNLQAGLLEEVVFRGYLFQVLEKRWSTGVAAAVSALLFALSHPANPEQDYPTWMMLCSITLAGLVYAYAYLLHRSLWLPIGLHFAYDWLAALLGETGRGPAEAVLLATRASGPPLLQGPRFAGLGVFDLVGAAAVTLILWGFRKQRSPGASRL